MVATHTPILKLSAPMVIEIKGENLTFNTRDSIFDALRSLEQREKNLNNQAAYAAFWLGKALNEVKKKLQYGAINHLYADAGINRRRAQRCVKWADDYTATDGGFDFEKYRQGELLARNRHDNGTRPCKFDEQGSPSFTAVQEAVGHRAVEHAKSDRPVATTTQTNEPGTNGMTVRFDPMESLNALADEHAPAEKTMIPMPELRIAGGVIGDQMMIDFDMLASERKLAAAIIHADQAHADGLIDDEQAMAIDAALEELAQRVIQITGNITH